MRFDKYLVGAAFLFILGAGTASAALPATIAGYVKNAVTGKPIAGAKVSIKGGATVTTKANGAYLLTVPAGSVTLCSVSSGYTSTCTQRFNVQSGQAKTRNILLVPK